MGCGQLTNFMEQAENSGITELLSIPIVVVLSCSLYKENKSLPKRTELIEKIIFETIDKSLKKSGIEFPSEQIEACLAMLGKLSWESLLKQTQQLLIKKVNIPFSKAQKGSLKQNDYSCPILIFQKLSHLLFFLSHLLWTIQDHIHVKTLCFKGIVSVEDKS